MDRWSEPIPLQSLGPTPLDTPALLSRSSADDASPLSHTQSSFEASSISQSHGTDHNHLARLQHDAITESTSNHDVESTSGDFIPALPPVDRGKAAWSFLVAATMMEILVWGLPFAVGILHEYWLSTLFRGEGESTITLAAILQTGLLYMSTAAFTPILAAFPRRMREIQSVCLFVAAGGLIASAFATKPWHLIVSIGILYPFAGASYVPAATLLFEWFHVKRGLATGILYGGTGAGGAIFPLVVSGLLHRVGYKATMISLGLALLLIGHICMIFIKRRIPIPSRADSGTGQGRLHNSPKIDWSFLTRPTFFSGITTILITSLGSFVPLLWLPTYASDLQLNKPGGTALVSILNGASGPGYILMGFLSDRYPLFHVLNACCLGSSLACFFLWGFGTTNTVIVLFVLVFGMLGPSITALWSRMISVIARDDPTLPQFIFCIFAFTRGIGNITSGPISDALLKYDTLRGGSGAYGVANYGTLLIYTGATIFSGCFTGLFFYARREKYLRSIKDTSA